MRRFLSTGLAALFAFSLIACGGGDSGAQAGAEQTATPAAETAPAAALTVPDWMTVDNAAARGLAPLARIVAHATYAQEPEWFTTSPVAAVKRLHEKLGWTPDNVDLYEVNEAFASVVLAWAKEVGADLERTNPNGGAIALGHPLGGTGAFLMTKALHELDRTGGRYGLVSMCCGGGLGTGTIIERL